MIYHFNTLFSGNSIGAYYNACCRIVPDNNWICLWDSDIMLFNTITGWNDFFEKAIAKNPDVRLFSCMAGRIGTHKQRIAKEQDINPSMIYHRDIQEQRFAEYGIRIRKDVASVSGMMLLFEKKTWQELGGFSENGILGVDTVFSRAVSGRGWKIGIMEGLCVMHYYRLKEGNAGHLEGG